MSMSMDDEIRWTATDHYDAAIESLTEGYESANQRALVHALLGILRQLQNHG